VVGSALRAVPGVVGCLVNDSSVASVGRCRAPTDVILSLARDASHHTVEHHLSPNKGVEI
jgi:hypothetical protein